MDPSSAAAAAGAHESPPITGESPDFAAVALSGRDLALSRRRLQTRRTLIPIMLTTGFLFCGIGAAQWLTDDEYPFAARNLLWCAIALPAMGALLLAMAAINMAWVANHRHENK